MIDLTTLTPDELDALRVNVQTEQERRARLALIPTQIAELTARYIEDGGDPADLH